MKIGFWGVGAMGGPLARRLVAAGYEVVAYSRSLEKAEAAASAGPTGRATDKREELASCGVVFTCLALPEHVREAMSGPAGLYARLAPGATHVECSTIDPFLASVLAEEAENRGIAYVQATLGKTPAVAAAGGAPLFVGGEEAVKERLWPMLTAMGKPVDVGSISASCAVKLISNLVGMANLAVLAEGLRVGQCAGIEPEKLLPLLADTGAHSFQMDVRGPWMARKDFMPRFALRLAHKDLRLGCEMAQRWKQETPLLNAARAVFARAEALGLGGQDCAAVSCVTEQEKEGA